MLDRKNANVENKQAHLHELLMKKLSKEKKLRQRLEDQQADQVWVNERKAEKLQSTKERKEELDDLLMKKKLAEFQNSAKKHQRVSQNRNNMGINIRYSVRNNLSGSNK